MDLPIDATLAALQQRLLAARAPHGGWDGRLSSSALSTATAVIALAAADPNAHAQLISTGLGWLAKHTNADGGWGDTTISRSNLPTTLLSLAAFRKADTGEQHAGTIAVAEAHLTSTLGGMEPDRIAAAISDCYGDDRTFAAPILTACAISGLLGQSPAAWSHVPPLPLELAVLNHRTLRWFRVGVVSYALPALIAIGTSVFRNRRPKPVLKSILRRLALPKALKKLQRIQPESGGFLEAAPLTSFVVMNLVAAGEGGGEVARRGVEFLRATARDDGSWPIDTNLSTWVTTLAVGALPEDALDAGSRQGIRRLLLDRQCKTHHLYTGAAPGGWAWTGLSGGVPDGDDTAGAMLALRRLGTPDRETTLAATTGTQWLLGIQNTDGGIPTFCRGWGNLPFDRSCPDLTAHAARALATWAPEFAPALRMRSIAGIERCLDYLADSQERAGTWRPLWFGNEAAPGQANGTYGTAKVLLALAELPEAFADRTGALATRAIEALQAMQGDDGGWGGDAGVASSIEETAVAVEALAAAGGDPDHLRRGTEYLIEATARGTHAPAAPIGLYFASLWYFEELYPLIFTLAALRRARVLCCPAGHDRMTEE